MGRGLEFELPWSMRSIKINKAVALALVTLLCLCLFVCFDVKGGGPSDCERGLGAFDGILQYSKSVTGAIRPALAVLSKRNGGGFSEHSLVFSI